MARELQAGPQAEASLDALVEAERELNARLARAQDQCDVRVRQAAVAAQQRVAMGRKRIAADTARRDEENRMALDAQLAQQADQIEREIAGRADALQSLRVELHARILAEVLGHDRPHG